MEDERRINWLSLFIKIVIIFIFALIIIWLVSKIINKNKLSETFNNNINNRLKKSFTIDGKIVGCSKMASILSNNAKIKELIRKLIH